MRRLLILLLVGLILLVAPGAAAHSSLLGGSPGPGDEVAPGAGAVALEFEAVAVDGEHTIALLDADDNPLPVGAVQVVDERVVCARVEPMDAGVHTVEYSVTSSDGHEVRGRYLFEVVQGGDVAEDLGCAAADLPAPEDAESLGFEPAGVPAWVWWLLVPVLVVAAALAALAVARSRRGEA